MRLPWVSRRTAERLQDELSAVAADRDFLISEADRARVDHAEMVGKLRGRIRGLELSLKPDMLDQMAARIAWYENLTRIVVGGRVEQSGTGLCAGSVRCERCKLQIAWGFEIKHLVEHGMLDGVIPIKRLHPTLAEDRAAIDALLDEDRVPGTPPRRRRPTRRTP